MADLLRAGADPEILDLIGKKAIEFANPKTKAIFDFELSANQVEEEQEAVEEEEA